MHTRLIGARTLSHSTYGNQSRHSMAYSTCGSVFKQDGRPQRERQRSAPPVRFKARNNRLLELLKNISAIRPLGI